MIGKTIKERYLIEAKLGAGGMGTVFRAHDQLLDRQVALKVINQHVMHDEVMAERFLREARAVSRLNHPHIMRLYDMDKADDLAFLVVELIDGRTLTEVLPDLSPTAKLDVAQQVTSALAYAHAQGVVHRDLKPPNIMLLKGADVAVQLLDFGLAIRLDDSRVTGTGMIVGTFAYMSPEQATGQVIEAASDLYTLGVILYEMFAGSLPYTADGTLGLIYQIANVDPQPARWLRPDLPAELDALIMQLLHKNPAARPADADAVLQRLQNITFEQNQDTAVFAPSSIEAVPGQLARGVLVGRTPELTQMKGWIEGARHGKGQLGLISGATGSGKTRLVEEALIYARLRGMLILQARIYRGEGTLPFQPVISALRSMIAETPADNLVLQNLMSGKEFSTSVATDSTRQLNQLWTEYLRARAAEKPLLFLFDDLHWADSATFNLILHLSRHMSEEQLLIIGTYADDLPTPPGLTKLLVAQKRERLGQRIALSALNQRQTQMQLETMFGEAVSTSFIETIFAKSAGNPLYVEEIARWLVDEDIATMRHDGWHIASTTHWQLPPTLQSIVEDRFEHASAECRQLLEMAAVIGNEFSTDLLVSSSAQSEDEVLDTLDLAIEANLILPERAGGWEKHSFSHPPIRHLLYQNLSLRRRGKMHQRVGAAIIQLRASRIVDYYGVLAHHFSQAPGSKTLPQAVAYALKAGDVALGRSDLETAHQYVKQAHGWLESRSEDFKELWIEVDTKLAHLQEMLGREAVMTTSVTASGVIPWVPLNKPLSQCRIALITTAGVHLRSQLPFSKLDHTARAIPGDAPTDVLMITHDHYDHSDADKDINLVFPLPLLRTLADENFIGSVSATHYGIMGHLPDPEPLLQETAPQLFQQLQADQVDVVLLTPG